MYHTLGNRVADIVIGLPRGEGKPQKQVDTLLSDNVAEIGEEGSACKRLCLSGHCYYNSELDLRHILAPTVCWIWTLTHSPMSGWTNGLLRLGIYYTSSS